jgi:transposase-like protein
VPPETILPLVPEKAFCPNPDCPAKDQVGRGNLGVHAHQARRFICHVCHKTFSEHTGTAFYRLQKHALLVTQVLTLLAHGCPRAVRIAKPCLHT